MNNQKLHPWFRHLCDVIAAPVNAHITDTQRAQQDFNPSNFYL